MARVDCLQRITIYNYGRDPERLRRKYAATQADAFPFLRGTCHLFYEDWPHTSLLNDAPRTWICGDLHLENFGSYKGDKRLTYFDLNDFDESVLAPCTWDVARFLADRVALGTGLMHRLSSGLHPCVGGWQGAMG